MVYGYIFVATKLVIISGSAKKVHARIWEVYQKRALKYNKSNPPSPSSFGCLGGYLFSAVWGNQSFQVWPMSQCEAFLTMVFSRGWSNSSMIWLMASGLSSIHVPTAMMYWSSAGEKNTQPRGFI